MSYKKIVVPLDGSKLAETALSHVEEIATGCNVAEIALVSVTQEVKLEPNDYSPSTRNQFTPINSGDVFLGSEVVLNEGVPINKTVVVGKMAKSASDYLIKIAKQLEKKGLNPTVNVLKGNVAKEIVHFAADEKADLIIMASYGKSGIRRWDVSNAALAVFRTANIPVLMVKPPAGFKETKPRRTGKAF